MATQVPIPFSENPWLKGLPSPYYNDSHFKWQKTCRDFLEENFTPYVAEWEKAKELPGNVWDKFARKHFILGGMPAPLPVEILRKVGITHLPGGLAVEDFDYFHHLIYNTELYRAGILGPPAGIMLSTAFAMPPIYKYGNKQLQDKFLPDLLLGKIRACIAVTEPQAGSDVAGLTTTAELAPDGKHYIINGSKKWISTGIWADVATTAVRTGGPGANGISMIVIPLKNTAGVNIRRMEVSGNHASGTAFIEFDDVKVSAGNIIGNLGHGLKYALTNFSHERLAWGASGTMQARKALSTAFAYCMKREAFGKTLIQQPVVRNRLARCGADLEALWALVEQLTYQMANLPKAVSDVELGGQTAMLKAKTGMVLDECSRCAVLLMGGAGMTQSGQGEIVEMIQREVFMTRVTVGSEDVMLDLSIRELLKGYQTKTKALGKSSAKI